MTTTLNPPVSRVRHRSASGHLRFGFKGASSSAGQLMACCQQFENRLLLARATALLESVSDPLRGAAQQVLVHPTLQTLKDGFDAADAVLVICTQLTRRARSLQKPETQVHVAVLVAGVRAGIAELELGMECIPMLPASATEYPEEA